MKRVRRRDYTVERQCASDCEDPNLAALIAFGICRRCGREIGWEATADVRRALEDQAFRLVEHADACERVPDDDTEDVEPEE